MSDSLYRYRPLVIFGVLAYWSVSLIDGLPPSNVVHERLNDWVDPMLNRTSIWQSNWNLFAPEIDHWNSGIECVITWDDGTESVWTHPDWTTASRWERFRNFRRIEYYERLTLNQGQPAWPVFAEITATQLAQEQGKTPRLAELFFHGETIPPPEEIWRKAYTAPQFEPPLKFYTWYPNAISESETYLFGN